VRAQGLAARRDRGGRALGPDDAPAGAAAGARRLPRWGGGRDRRAKLDRLSRSLVDFAALLAEARAGSWNLVALDSGWTSRPSGEFLANIMASAAQWERRLIGLRTKEALAVRRREGVRLGRPATITPRLARRIRSLRTRGHTLQAISDRLNAEGVPTPRGGASWRPSSLRAVLARR
jgi:Resolvase, N terminal domain/Recombinase